MSQHFSFAAFDPANATANPTNALNMSNVDTISVVDSSHLGTALSEMKAAEWNDELALKHLPALSSTLSSHFQWMNCLALNPFPDGTHTSTAAFHQQFAMQPVSLSNEMNVNQQEAQNEIKVQQQQQQSYPLAQAANLQHLLQLQLMNPAADNESCVTPIDDGRPIIAATISQHSPTAPQQCEDQHSTALVESVCEEQRPAKSRRVALKDRQFASPLSSSALSSAGVVSEQLSRSSSCSSEFESYSKNRVDAREARKRKLNRVHELENTIHSLQKELKELRQLAEKQQAQHNHHQQPDIKPGGGRDLIMHTTNQQLVANNSNGMTLAAGSMTSSSSASSSSAPLQPAASSTPATVCAGNAQSMSVGSASVGECHQSEERMKELLNSYILAAFEEAKQAEKYDVSAVIKKYHHDPEKAFQALVELQAELKKRKSSSAIPSPTRSDVLMEEFMSAYRQWLGAGASHFASLAHHVHPTLPLHLLHWLSNHADSFYADRSSLWHALFCDELAFSPQQMKELNALRQSWKKNSKATVEVEKCFGRLKELMDKQKKMELEEFQQIRNIFSPIQMAKFLNWAGHFAAICIPL